MTPLFSVLVPAHNEEAWIGGCLDSVAEAARPYGEEVEVVVALNRCTDRTEAIARDRNARTLHVDGKNLSRIRNAAAAAGRGRYLVTVDADSRLSRNFLMEVEAALARDDTVGGGAWIWSERYSAGIVVTGTLIWIHMLLRGIAAGAFWCRREDFDAVGGFDETRLSAEDLDFAARLRAHGRATGRRFRLLPRASIVTSARKFDRFGDWYMLCHLREMPSLLAGRNEEAANRFWYDVRN